MIAHGGIGLSEETMCNTTSDTSASPAATGAYPANKQTLEV
jgi:hypothetical protein